MSEPQYSGQHAIPQGQPVERGPGQHPAPPHPGPQHPGQYPGQQSPPQHPGQQYPARQGSDAGGSLGRVAFIVALVALAIGLLVTLSFPFITRSLYDPSAIGAIGAVGNGFVLVASIAALVLGVVAVRRQEQRILAGIAIGISSSAIAGILLSWLANLTFALIYS